MNSRNVNDENVIKGTNRNYGSNRNSGNVNNRNNRNDYKGNGNDGINDDTKRNKQKKYVWYGKNSNSESGARNQSNCKECNVRKKRHISRQRVKRYNSRDDLEVTYNLSGLPSGSFCGNNTTPGNLQHNSNYNGNGNKNINNGHGDYGNSNGSGGAERCKIINKVKCPSN